MDRLVVAEGILRLLNVKKLDAAHELLLELLTNSNPEVLTEAVELYTLLTKRS